MDAKLAEAHRYDSVFWVEVEKIRPNPYQPRKEFDEINLKTLAESIRQYGVLQPLVVTRAEISKEDGGIQTVYELIAGERRLRASKLVGLREVPVVIRTQEENGQMKLELAIIENLQREDLNAVDRAKAFEQLAREFNLTHAEIGKKMGKSREYVSNTIRLLGLPEEIQEAIRSKMITEGHARPLLMLSDKPDEQATLYKEILTRKISVRDSEQLARRIAVEKTRKNDLSPELQNLERELSDALKTRVHIAKGESGGKVVIDFFSDDDLAFIHAYIAKKKRDSLEDVDIEEPIEDIEGETEDEKDDEDDAELYSINNFTL
ncbi:MAG: ParB/RepB/Spo0J family partition protein [Patescibacteria group bacterium UBA2103]